MADALTPRQRRVLEVLADNRHAWLNPGYVWRLAFGDTEPYRGRRDAGMTSTLDTLRRRGFVDGVYGGRWASGRTWRITDAGIAALRAAVR